ncbi:hypothetical protein DL93DRAFT_2077308 [Clavulina sp. PMI_390]|nr:hypothetical protein DL93DRAFT_2077308 [Clavulina sp. PMI_390]
MAIEDERATIGPIVASSLTAKCIGNAPPPQNDARASFDHSSQSHKHVAEFASGEDAQESVSPSASTSVLSLQSLATIQSELSYDVPDSQLSLSEFCTLIDSTGALQDVEILNVKSYAISKGLYCHRLLVIELSMPHARYLRLERRRVPSISPTKLLRNGGHAPTYDLAFFSSDLSVSTRGGTLETHQTFARRPSLGELQFLLSVVSRELTTYKLWSENCWFFVSLVQHFLQSHFDGILREGRLQFPRLAYRLRLEVQEHLRLHYHMPRPFSLTELLRSFQRGALDYPSAIQGSLPQAIELASAWEERASRRRTWPPVSNRTLSARLSEIAFHLRHETFNPPATLLWDWNVKILAQMSQSDASSHRSDMAHAMRALAICLKRGGDLHTAERMAGSAVGLLKAQERTTSGSRGSPHGANELIGALSTHHSILISTGDKNEALKVYNEVVALRRQVFMAEQGHQSSELRAFVHAFAAFVSRPLEPEW